jgi:hypothetical protein
VYKYYSRLVLECEGKKCFNKEGSYPRPCSNISKD